MFQAKRFLNKLRQMALSTRESMQFVEVSSDGLLTSPPRSEWPRVLETVLDRLDHVCLRRRLYRQRALNMNSQNVHNAFVIPTIRVATIHRTPPSTPPKSTEQTLPSSIASRPQDTSDTQDAPPSSPPQALQPTTPPLPPPTNGATENALALPSGTLPPPLLSILTHVKTTLSTSFPTQPPHTIQRLAELVLRPKEHYRRLHTYLNALDRVVSVSSCNIAHTGAAAVPQMVNGTNHTAVNSAFSDDSLGGALLTPIPWLVNGAGRSRSASVTIEAEHATNGSHEVNGIDAIGDEDVEMTMEEHLREIGGITQGELLRQEQEASSPPAPVGSSANRDHVVATAVTAETQNAADASDEAHEVNGGGPKVDEENGASGARGPSGIGAEDIGSQENGVRPGQVLDLQAAVGRTPQPENEVKEDTQGPEATQAAESTTESASASTEQDIEMADLGDETTGTDKVEDLDEDLTPDEMMML